MKEEVTILEKKRRGKAYVKLAKDRLFITTAAFEALGRPDYVRIGHFKSPPTIMLLSAKKSDKDARTVLDHKRMRFVSVTGLGKETPEGKYYHFGQNIFKHEAYYKPKEEKNE